MGDCVHEDLIQIAYARAVRNHASDATQINSLLNPWAGTIQADARFASIAGDTVDIGEDKQFANADVNADGDVNSADSLLILKRAIGALKESDFPYKK
jgi:hypothetical protein